jgi:hypothetical protein
MTLDDRIEALTMNLELAARDIETLKTLAQQDGENIRALARIAEIHDRRIPHVPPEAKVLMPAAIERSVWEYFSGKAEQKGVDLSELLTEVLKRDIEINETLR